LKLGLNLEFIRHSDRSFEDGISVASEIGYRYVEPCLIQGHCTLSEAGYCHWQSMDSRDPVEMAALLARHSVQPSAVSAHAQLMQSWSVEHLIKAIRFAAKLGAPIVNTAEGKKPSWMSDDEAITVITIHLRRVLELAEEYDITIGLEPHGYYSTNPERLLDLLGRLESPKLKVNFDTGNTYLAGQDPMEYLRAIGDRVAHVHAKDIGGELLEKRGKVTGTPVGVACGDGVVDYPAIVDMLRERGFEGVLSVECGSEQQARRSYAYLTDLLEQVRKTG